MVGEPQFLLSTVPIFIFGNPYPENLARKQNNILRKSGFSVANWFQKSVFCNLRGQKINKGRRARHRWKDHRKAVRLMYHTLLKLQLYFLAFLGGPFDFGAKKPLKRGSMGKTEVTSGSGIKSYPRNSSQHRIFGLYRDPSVNAQISQKSSVNDQIRRIWTHKI